MTRSKQPWLRTFILVISAQEGDIIEDQIAMYSEIWKSISSDAWNRNSIAFLVFSIYRGRKIKFTFLKKEFLHSLVLIILILPEPSSLQPSNLSPNTLTRHSSPLLNLCHFTPDHIFPDEDKFDLDNLN